MRKDYTVRLLRVPYWVRYCSSSTHINDLGSGISSDEQIYGDTKARVRWLIIYDLGNVTGCTNGQGSDRCRKYTKYNVEKIHP